MVVVASCLSRAHSFIFVLESFVVSCRVSVSMGSFAIVVAAMGHVLPWMGGCDHGMMAMELEMQASKQIQTMRRCLDSSIH